MDLGLSDDAISEPECSRPPEEGFLGGWAVCAFRAEL